MSWQNLHKTCFRGYNWIYFADMVIAKPQVGTVTLSSLERPVFRIVDSPTADEDIFLETDQVSAVSLFVI